MLERTDAAAAQFSFFQARREEMLSARRHRRALGLQVSAMRPLCLRIPAYSLEPLPAKVIRCGADGFLYMSRIRAPDPLFHIPYSLSSAHPPSTAP